MDEVVDDVVELDVVDEVVDDVVDPGIREEVLSEEETVTSR